MGHDSFTPFLLTQTCRIHNYTVSILVVITKLTFVLHYYHIYILIHIPSHDLNMMELYSISYVVTWWQSEIVQLDSFPHYW